MAAFKTKAFLRFARKARLGDFALIETAAEVSSGVTDADLGGGEFKRRVARLEEGKFEGFRTIALFRRGCHVFFVYGFAENARDDIRLGELAAIRRLANVWLYLDAQGQADAVNGGELVEVMVDG